jgi:hypothetical protein
MRKNLGAASKKAPEGASSSPNWTRTNNPSVSGPAVSPDCPTPRIEKSLDTACPQPLTWVADGGHLNIIERWCAALRADGARPGTVALRRHYLKRFAAQVEPLTATTADVVDWLNDHEWSPETRKSAQAALRGFFAWALDEGLIEVNPTARIRPVRVPPGKPKPTPEIVLERAMAAASEPERCMLALAAWGGLRRNEIAELRWSDVGVDSIRVRGKGGRVRVVPLHARVEFALWERKNSLTTEGGGRSRTQKRVRFRLGVPQPSETWMARQRGPRLPPHRRPHRWLVAAYPAPPLRLRGLPLLRARSEGDSGTARAQQHCHNPALRRRGRGRDDRGGAVDCLEDSLGMD